MPGLDQTHDPSRRSWVESANAPDADFPIQNLPYGVFSTGDAAHRIGVAIGDAILDLSFLEEAGLLHPGGETPVFDRGILNPFMAMPRATWTSTRAAIADLLDATTPTLRDDGDLRTRALVPQAEARLHLPIFVRSYTDFYASRHHAENVGTLFRGKEHALPPNWLHIPIGYNGRASTVVVSGEPIRRPLGQLKRPGDAAPRFAPCEKLDIELELAAVVGRPSKMGTPITTTEAAEMIFGYVLLNDWSARDIQVWEYQPLGPFQSKVFASSVSPWIVTADALAPFRVAAPEPEKPLLPYLRETEPGLYDIHLEVTLAPEGRAPTYLAAQTAFSFDFDSSLEIVTKDDQKLAVASSGSVALERPDKFHATRNGGFAAVEANFDGKTLTLFNKDANVYAEAEVPGTIDHLIDELRETYHRPLPAADLLLSNVNDALMPLVTDVKDLGSGVIGGVECDHLAFRMEEVDWQIWIAQGERPHPCRYVITSTKVTGWPQYTIDVRDWRTGAEAAHDFAFQAPADANKVEAKDLPDFDDLAGIYVIEGAQ
jgi:fumarylacetoacetase